MDQIAASLCDCGFHSSLLWQKQAVRGLWKPLMGDHPEETKSDSSDMCTCPVNLKSTLLMGEAVLFSLLSTSQPCMRHKDGHISHVSCMRCCSQCLWFHTSHSKDKKSSTASSKGSHQRWADEQRAAEPQGPTGWTDYPVSIHSVSTNSQMFLNSCWVGLRRRHTPAASLWDSECHMAPSSIFHSKGLISWFLKF